MSMKYKKDPLFQPGTIVKLEGKNRAFMIVGTRKIYGDHAFDYAGMDFPDGVYESKITADDFHYFDHVDIESSVYSVFAEETVKMVEKQLGIVKPSEIPDPRMKDMKKTFLSDIFEGLKGDDTQ